MYLLDTNICIYLIKKNPSSVVKQVKNHKPYQIKISAITIAELEYGVSKSLKREQNRNAVMDFVSAFDIVNTDFKFPLFTDLAFPLFELNHYSKPTAPTFKRFFIR